MFNAFRSRSACAFAISLAIGSLVFAEDTLEFARDIRPILSDKCFFCHGPDEADRQADLRLDQEEAAKEYAIVPGNIEESELMARILSDDEDEQMPPPESGKQLSEEEISRLKRWIKEGAEWADHWSFEPISALDPPALADEIPKTWNQNPIDAFVAKEMHGQRLQPNPTADRNTLIRRVTLDLTGLPPTPEEVDAFLADDGQGAYERVVDRLLASDAYGERMTLAWMDAARYGDTSVMHADGPRDMWPWRDWVIRAYKNNKPFNEFLLEQLAGDFLPNATTDQKLATGFLRNNASSDEGGAFPEELRVEYVVDRVKTTFNVFQGLSAECAQCHSHKYDPISHEEYYGLFAFFNNAADPGMQSRAGNQTPIVRVHSPETLAQMDEIQKNITTATSEWNSSQPEAALVDRWIREHADGTPATHTVTWHELSSLIEVPDLDAAWKTQPIAPDAPILVDQPVEVGVGVGEEKHTWTKRDKWNKPGKHRMKSTKSCLPYLTVDFEANKRMAGEFRLKTGHAYQVWRDGELLHETKFTDRKKPVEAKFELGLRAGHNRLLIKIGSKHKDGFSQEWGFTPKATPEDIGKLATTLCQQQAKPNSDSDDSEVPTADDEADSKGRAASETNERAQLTEYFKQHLWVEGLPAKVAVDDLKREHDRIRDRSISCMVMEDLPKVRPTYILDRGQYDSPKEDRVIQPDTPAALGQLGETYPRNRLGLAKWMVRDDHPLTARVAVNRYWYLLFGRGLVNTVMDFGGQGSMPTHPDLLDWLANDFRDHGWDVKRTLKQMVTSKTYRQSSRFSDEHKKVDPQNIYLARASRFRLQGDFIRDQALAVSGLLVNKVGGPGVKPYQPAGLWNEVSLNKGLRFTQDHGEALYRRSMYIYWKRSAPHPSMQIFDAPTREKCTVARPRTNTPLQALVTLNDVQFVESSRKLAARIMKEGGDDFSSRLEYGYQLCAARAPKQREIKICEGVYENQLASFWDDEERAKQYLDHGESKRDESLAVTEHAAWTVIANLLLNLDEVLMRN